MSLGLTSPLLGEGLPNWDQVTVVTVKSRDLTGDTQVGFFGRRSPLQIAQEFRPSSAQIEGLPPHM